MRNLATKDKNELINQVELLQEELNSLKEQQKESGSSAEKLARVILDEMYQFVALLDYNGNILEVNKTALEGGGQTLEQIAGNPFWEAKWWKASEETQKRLQDAIEKSKRGEFIRYEVKIFGGASGKELIWIDFSLNPVKNSSGEIIYLLAEGRNITEKKIAEEKVLRQKEELSQLYQKLKAFDELKTQFFANVSHELRTPLALILGPVNDILKSQALTDEERQNLEVIGRNARILLKQVNDLLDIAKLEAGKMELTYVRTNLAELVRLATSNFESLASEKKISFSTETPVSIPSEIDADKFQRIVLNLLSNAFKYTPSGGSINCKLEQKGQNATLTVSDSGPGVKEENREAVFERFRQLEGGTTRKFGGTGLGLAIVKDFLDLHRGKISIGDSPKGGALFTVDIPIVAPENAEVHAVKVQEAGYIEDVSSSTIEEIQLLGKRNEIETTSGGAPLILVVEDNPDLNTFLTKTLSKDYRIASAMDGQEGLEKAINIKPDLILSDVMMPLMSGDQMVEEIRENQELNRIPIIMLTAKADDALKLKMLSGGVQDYLVKPFSSEEVKARVNNLISLKLAQKELKSSKEELAEVNENLEQKIEERTRELLSSTTQLERRTTDLDNFIYTASHDLKAPICNLEGLTDELAAAGDHKWTEDEKQMLALINTSVERLKQTIIDLTEVSKVQVEISEDVESVSFPEIFQEIKEVLRKQIESSGAKIETDFKEKIIEYPKQNFRSIIYNLVANAIKYNHPERTPLIKVITYQEADYVVLSVTDNGLGFNPEDKDKIFKMFKRMHSHVEGSGIGLYIVKRIIENNNGKLEVDSEVNKGSEFRVYFKKDRL